VHKGPEVKQVNGKFTSDYFKVFNWRLFPKEYEEVLA
jgi:hypothetical protein